MKTFWSIIALSLLLVVTSWAQSLSHSYNPVGSIRGPQLYVTSDPDDLNSARLGGTPF